MNTKDKIRAGIQKGIDIGIGLAKKVKEYMVDDTINDLNKMFGPSNSQKEK